MQYLINEGNFNLWEMTALPDKHELFLRFDSECAVPIFLL